MTRTFAVFLHANKIASSKSNYTTYHSNTKRN